MLARYFPLIFSFFLYARFFLYQVVMDYRARLRHTKDGALAYTLPSTLTTLAVVADESSYPKSGDGGAFILQLFFASS